MLVQGVCSPNLVLCTSRQPYYFQSLLYFLDVRVTKAIMCHLPMVSMFLLCLTIPESEHCPIASFYINVSHFRGIVCSKSKDKPQVHETHL